MAHHLKQEDLMKALTQLTNIRDLIDDGYHSDELEYLAKVSDKLFNELNKANKRKFQIWLEIVDKVSNL